jgi:alpha-tubulin suppressor-like RCC1 family protein
MIILKFFKHFLLLSIVMLTVSGCLFEPKTFVSLKNKALETFDPGNNGGGGNASSSAILSANLSGFCLTESTSELCWGKSTTNEVATPYAKAVTGYLAEESVLYGKTIKKYSVGAATVCAIASDDKLYCWGNTLGNGTIPNSGIPVAVNTSGVLNGKTIIDVDISNYTACAIDSTFKLYCWGINNVGQLGAGNGVSPSSAIPLAVAGGLSFKEVKIGEDHVCAIATDDRVYCWGRNDYGQIGNGSLINSDAPELVDFSAFAPGLTATSLYVQKHFNCIIASDGRPYCWGGTGNAVTTPRSYDNGAFTGLTVEKLSITSNILCVIGSDHFGYCSGVNNYGQLGNGSTTASATFVAINKVGDLSAGFKEISVNDFQVCAIALSGKAYCWGANGIGDGAADVAGVFADVLSPSPVDTSGVLSGVTLDSIHVGPKSICAIGTNAQIYCWGPEAKRGDGTDDYLLNVPVSVVKKGQLVGKTFKEVQSNFYVVCALASDDQLYCWGSARDAQGSGSNYDQKIPTPVYSASISNANITNIVFKHRDKDGNVCVQRSNGDFYCNDIYYEHMLFKFSMGSEIFEKMAYSKDLDAYCALTTNKKVYCWGSSYGIFLNSDVESSNLPIEIDTSGVLSGKVIDDLVVGDASFACVLANDQVYCWGSNTYGQLGDGTLTDSQDPVAVTTSGVLNGKSIKSITTAYGTVCAIANDDRAYCWGKENNLGNGAAAGNENLPSEVQLPIGEIVQKLVMTEFNVCALTGSEALYCWGSGTKGVLGAGVAATASSPVLVSIPGISTVKDFSVSEEFACAIGGDDKAYCWGIGTLGQMGNGANAAMNTPTAVSALPGVLDGVTLQNIATTDYSACALSVDSKLYCWGKNNDSQLGNNDTTNSNVPVVVEFTP